MKVSERAYNIQELQKSGVCECVMSVLVRVRELWMQCGEVEIDRWVDREIKRER